MPEERRPAPDERVPGAHVTPQLFYEDGPNAGSVGRDSTKVGWTLRNSDNRVIDAFAFVINPQGLSRSQGNRASLFSTQGGHFVDDFGPAAARIQLRQLVASGKSYPDGLYTAREDVQRFIKRIYSPATTGVPRKRYRVFFHDHHFERGFEERVFFPSDALSIERSVDLHNVWRLDLQMVSLEKYPLDEIDVQGVDSDAVKARLYRVQRGDTFARIVARLAGPQPSRAKLRAAVNTLLELNPQLRVKRRVPDVGGQEIGKPMKLYVGETIALPR